MDSDTKRHIDAARQVLVGVVPNPASQIDQITNALIYKFMDDMDRASINAEGEATFFTGDLKPYAWEKCLMDPRIGNRKRMNLYSEALDKFSEAEQLPELFQEIFADAFMPYRSPETLGLFLKEINYFNYSHPEELGNAYEYLLSIMSSQGDAGQFRTPRHIIDFIVNVVNPTKDDRILDPACGTGGFLVSSYRRILEQHDGKNDPEKKEKPLTYSDREKLKTNFEGYEIDPSMARIARVNMYLHQFKTPQIHQYDTLSDDLNWEDKFDVILANPPFMSPKGGILPHNRFSIRSSRSEVLFVDYIMSHLRPRGRAGIIVPEGVIFQSGTAYKELRKNLVEDGLYAVVSLPGGVFLPYSGVKTSILLFNNEVAKQCDEILFVKVENDGFALGATRRPINQNDLPVALDILNRWLMGEKSNSKLALYVKKPQIAEDGKYDLTGDHYQKTEDYSNVKWPIVELGEVCDIKRGKSITKKDVTHGEIPVIAGGQQPSYYHNQSNRTGKTITVSGSGAYAGFVNYFETPIFASDCSTIKSLDENKLRTKFCFYLLKAKQREIYKLQSGMGQPHVYPRDLEKIKIPLPKIEFQEQIVLEIDQYQKIIGGAKLVVQNWKPYFRIEPEWETVKLKEISNRVTKGTTPTTNGFKFQADGINFIKIEAIDDDGCFIEDKFAHINEECNESLRRSQLRENDILFSIAGALGRVALVNPSILPANTNQALAIISPQKELNPKYLEQVLRSDLIQSQISRLKVGVAQSNLSLAQVSNFKIPFPSLEVQSQIVSEIEVEQKAINECKTLIGVTEKKIKAKLAKVWGE